MDDATVLMSGIIIALAYFSPVNEHFVQNKKLSHSGIGILSFLLSVMVGIFVIVFLSIAEAIKESGREVGIQSFFIGIALLLCADFVAFILGAASLFQKDRNKLFPILGTVFFYTRGGCDVLYSGHGGECRKYLMRINRKDTI